MIYRTTLVIMILLSFACDIRQSVNDTRKKYMTQFSDDLQIAIVSSSDMKKGFLEGIQIAIDRVNEYGILGKKIYPVFYDDDGDFRKAQSIAEKLAKNKKIMAVIGHNHSEIATATSITYEKAGIIFISPGATKPDLLQNQFKYVFSNTPSSEQMLSRMLEYARNHQLQKIAMVYDINNEMTQLANYFMTKAQKYNCQIVGSRSYMSLTTNFKNIINELKKNTAFDALFISGKLPNAAIFIKQARKMGINQPFIATNYLNSSKLFQVAETYAYDVVVPTYFDPLLALSPNRTFVNLFNQKTGNSPDELSASAYDAIFLLVHAIEQSGSFIPDEVATSMHLIQNWYGACGKISINSNGGISDKVIFAKKSTADNFIYTERQLLGKVNIFETIKDFTLRIPIEQRIQTIDPGLIYNSTSIDIVEQLFLGLTDFDPKTYKPVPELATSWTVNSDLTSYTFTLRKNVFWTDNTKVTAHDIQWAILRNLHSETQSPYKSTLFILKNARSYNDGNIADVSEIGIKVINDYKISFQLEKPAPYFPSMAGLCVFRPLPRHTIKKYHDTWTDVDHIVSNGSYKLAAWEESLMMVLRKNEAYFDAKQVSIPEVRYLLVSDERLGIEMYQSGEIDIMGGYYLKIPTDWIYDLSMNPSYKNQYFKKEIFCSYAFAFNTIQYPMDNLYVRKAINAAIDRGRINQYLLKGKQTAANNFTPQLDYCSQDQETFNSKAAKKWLSKAGFPDGKGFPEIIIAFNQSDRHETIARGVKDCLMYYLNIKAKLLPLKWEKYLDSITSDNDWHLIRYGWCSDYPDPNNWLNEHFHPKNKENVVRWQNKEFLQIMNIVDHTKNFSKRMSYYCQAEKVLCQKACAIAPMYFESSHYLVHPRMKGWYHMPLGGQHIRNWSFQK